MDSKFIKSQQCSLEFSLTVLTEINLNFDQGLALFLTKTDS